MDQIPSSKSDLINVIKQADEIPDVANNIHITTIWYLAAIWGETPDKICPVIIPGKATNPTANKEFIIGIREALRAIPLASMYSTSSLLDLSVRSSICLAYAGIETFGKLLEISEY